MGERASQDQQNGTKSPRLGLRHTGGEIVEVQGGHIVRSLARKDRHSKVSTAKGPRDRRVRLSAHAAIQFYDVQDRLGFDRPSKAVDWLIKEAKSAIDELAELPAWKPTVDSLENLGLEGKRKPQEQPQHQQFGRPLSGLSSNSWGINALQMNDDNLGEKNSSFLPLSLDSDTVQPFFPMGTSNSSVMQFQSFPPPPDLPPKTSSHSLRLSLQSFQDPIFRGHQHSLAYNAPSSGLSELNAGGNAAASGFGEGFTFNPQLLFGQNQFVSQGGPLQSSINTQSIRTWISPSSSLAAADHLQHHHNSHQLQCLPILSGFCIPARIQGEEEEHDGFSDKPSSVSRQ